jgi:hypothetical protein
MHSALCSKTVLMLVSLKCGIPYTTHNIWYTQGLQNKTPHMFKEAGKGITNTMMIIGTLYSVLRTPYSVQSPYTMPRLATAYVVI